MEAFTATMKNNGHFRSVSLPSRPHSSTVSVEEHLCRLRSSDATSSSSLSTKYNKLSGLRDLYECVDDLLQFPIMHSSDSEEVLGVSLRLLDLCNTTKDGISQMRASMQDLESSLRRREADVSNKVGNYFICLKKVNKMISKCFSNLKKLQTKKSNETSGLVSLLREVEEVSVAVFESLLSSVFPTTKQNRWSSVFRSTQSKRVHDQETSFEVQKMQIELEALYKQKSNMNSDFLRIQETQKCLMALDMNMQQCEEDLDCLFRSLIKTRVSILNVIN